MRLLRFFMWALPDEFVRFCPTNPMQHEKIDRKVIEKIERKKGGW